MDKKEKEKLNKTIEICEMLGAKKFKSFVLFLEKIKFKYGKKVLPNFLEFNEKIIDRKTKRALKKAKTEEEKKYIKEKALFSKLEARKEFNQEKNRNYHLDENNPKKTIAYLEWNKGVHKRGLTKDILVISGLLAALALGYGFVVPILLLETGSAVINFQCMNLQDYNISRLKLIEEGMVKRAERAKKKKIENYGEASELIYKSIEKSEEKIPTISEVVSNSKSIAQLEQLKALLLEEQKRRELCNNEVKGVIK